MMPKSKDFEAVTQNHSKETFLKYLELQSTTKLRSSSPLKPLINNGQTMKTNHGQLELSMTDEMTDNLKTKRNQLPPEFSLQKNATQSKKQSSVASTKTTARKLDDDNQHYNTPGARSTRTKKLWENLKSYKTYNDALQEIKKEKCWSIKSSSDTVVAFRCNKVRSRKKQCDSGKRIVINDDSVTIQASRNTHTCDFLEKSVKIPEETKAFIETLYQKGLKRKAIKCELVKAEFDPMPSKHVIGKVIHKLRKSDYKR